MRWTYAICIRLSILWRRPIHRISTQRTSCHSLCVGIELWLSRIVLDYLAKSAAKWLIKRERQRRGPSEVEEVLRSLRPWMLLSREWQELLSQAILPRYFPLSGWEWLAIDCLRADCLILRSSITWLAQSRNYILLVCLDHRPHMLTKYYSAVKKLLSREQAVLPQSLI